MIGTEPKQIWKTCRSKVYPDKKGSSSYLPSHACTLQKAISKPFKSTSRTSPALKPSFGSRPCSWLMFRCTASGSPLCNQALWGSWHAAAPHSAGCHSCTAVQTLLRGSPDLLLHLKLIPSSLSFSFAWFIKTPKYHPYLYHSWITTRTAVR